MMCVESTILGDAAATMSAVSPTVVNGEEQTVLTSCVKQQAPQIVFGYGKYKTQTIFRIVLNKKAL
jgi:hypothetical protein